MALRESGVRRYEFAIFDHKPPYPRNSASLQHMTKVLWIINRKSFRLVYRNQWPSMEWMTLNGHYALCRTLHIPVFGAYNRSLNVYTRTHTMTTISNQNVSPGILVSANIRFIRRSCWRVASNDSGDVSHFLKPSSASYVGGIRSSGTRVGFALLS